MHPYVSDVAGRLDKQKALGARGIKVHPVIQHVRPANERAMALYRMCGERALPIFFHCGPTGIGPRSGERLAEVAFYREAVADCPETTFVLGHTGALQCDEAIELAKTYGNVWVETASQSLPSVRKILDEAPPERIMFGSDWPLYHQATGLVKVLLATEDRPELRRKVLHDNAARLLGV